MEKGQRQALRRNQAADLILYGSLVTTEARARALKREVELLITKAKKKDLATRRWVIARLPRKEAVEKLFDLIIPQFKDRVGGFVRVVKLPPRRGDNALMARIEFVEEIKDKPAEKSKQAKRGEAKKVAKVKKKTGVRGDEKKNKNNKSKRG